MRILVVNAGSSSLKLHVHDVDGAADTPGGMAPTPHDDLVEDWHGTDVAPIAALVARTGTVDAVGHRVVHGGVEMRAPTLVDDTVVRRLRALVPLAPLHQERSLAGIRAARQALPGLPQVACFDTAYHATLSAAASTYALPAAWRERWPLRRFGFHGLSHAYAARHSAELVGRADDPDLRVVTCHLGAGASLCASLGGRSVDTTMGFTPLEGLVMATRAGSVDPGLVLWLITEAGLAPDLVRRHLEHHAGLAGLAGTPDMREVLRRRADGDRIATEAFDVYVHALCRHVAAMAAALDGLDVLTFTAGIGERSVEVRAEASDRLGFLGVAVDPARNQAGSSAGAGVISPDGTRVTTLVVAAREDVEIARQTADCLRGER